MKNILRQKAKSDDKFKEVIKKKQFKFKRRDLIFVVIGVFLAFLLRLWLVDYSVVHYHANFALYVDGKRELFDNFTYYEEVASCTTEDVFNPRSRVHMHGNINGSVHVHDAGATWGHFFANIGYALGDNVLVTDKGVYRDGADGKKLSFYLNGKEVKTIANRTINSKDRLLIDFGKTTPPDMYGHIASVPDDAEQLNSQPDPASCSGGTRESFKERVLRTLGIDTNNKNSVIEDHNH